MSAWRVDPVGPDRFRGHGADGAANRVFGGQVAAQALAAAGADLPDQAPASAHARFVREGRSADPIDYTVERHSAGFCRVIAAQRGRTILTLDAVFRPAAPVSPAAPAGPQPLTGWTPSTEEEAAWLDGLAKRMPFEFRFEARPTLLAGRRGDIVDGQRFWLRTAERLPDHPAAHACAVTYISDLLMVSTALARHGLAGTSPGVQSASLDHAVWFHGAFRADEWVRYDQTSPTAADGRALCEGRMTNAAGELIATVRQEILTRVP
ncbi:acyl-CoA thioesterase II [Virgisporangium aliadipatigenens]|uniref:Acyl-CoA thioesterase II n=1 Tax=Virgisporangium aliadipatigenens TaxID=741659 RepID=A0A8J3YU40_9ACTN|nr:acyl-CoA thioesterase domain-containing protein [Virgisporangium aliadipatigenens]GIJ51934.1 acyl-CoA thioesterase II [Virgisporangium aliadipatigenens]